jgi:hypothetical protein
MDDTGYDVVLQSLDSRSAMLARVDVERMDAEIVVVDKDTDERQAIRLGRSGLSQLASFCVQAGGVVD